MMRAALAMAVGSAAVVLAGCGTVANYRDRTQGTHIYGGVLRDLKAEQNWWADRPNFSKQTTVAEDAGTVVGVGLIGLDLVASAVGDTLTLPIAATVALFWPVGASSKAVSAKPAETPKTPNAPPPSPPAPPPSPEVLPPR